MSTETSSKTDEQRRRHRKCNRDLSAVRQVVIERNRKALRPQVNTVLARIGYNIQRLRAELGISQADLALNIGMNPARLCDIEKGITRQPSLATMVALSLVFKTPIDTFTKESQADEGAGSQ